MIRSLQLASDPRVPRHWNALTAPMSLGALGIWLAAVASSSNQWLHGRHDQDWLAFIGFAGQGALLLLFVVRSLAYASPGGRPMVSRMAILLQIPAVLAACAAFSDGLQPALTIGVAVQVALAFNWPTARIAIALTDLALAAVLLQRPQLAPDFPNWILLAAYFAFQIFGVRMALYACAAEQAREDALRINGELSATRQLLGESARSEERLLLSRELHDVAGHKLTALKLRLTLAERRGDSPAAVLADSRRLADELLTDIRSIVGTLREHDGIELYQALQVLTQALPYPPIELQADSQLRVTGVERAQTLLRCAQEGLTNVVRHSNATRACLRLEPAESGGVRLCVEDNGRGLSGAVPGNGLAGLRERLSALGGTLAVESVTGGGTRLVATLPPD